MVSIIEPVSNRVEHECDVYKGCGGCHLQHMDYECQLLHKKRVVEDVLERVGDIKSPSVDDVAGMNYPWQYRNKAQFPLVENDDGKLFSGFYRRGTHDIVVNEDCLIQHPLVNRTARKALEILNEYELSSYDEKHHRGFLRHLFVRAGVCTNQALLVIVTREEVFPDGREIAKKIIERVPELVGVMQNINSGQTNVILGNRTKLLAGNDYYTDYIGKLKFKISAQSFFQVNTVQTQKLYEKIKEYIAPDGDETVIDGYSGIGAISLFLAEEVKEVIGLETVEDAVRDARENAELNNIDNCLFYSGEMEELLPEICKKSDGDILVIDPPRKGLSSKAVEKILSSGLSRIVYVSCNPSTLARDIKLLNKDYDLKRVKPVDMFPQTYHIETVSLLEKLK